MAVIRRARRHTGSGRRMVFYAGEPGKNPDFGLYTDRRYRSWCGNDRHATACGEKTIDVPIKFLWCYASNTLINQRGDIAHTHEVLQDDGKCEMIVIERYDRIGGEILRHSAADLMPTEQEKI